MRQYFQFSGVITVFAGVIAMPLAFACITPRDAPTLFKHNLQKMCFLRVHAGCGHRQDGGIAGLLVTYPSDPFCCTCPQRPPPPDSSCFTVILKYPLFLGPSFYEQNSIKNACPLANPNLLQ